MGPLCLIISARIASKAINPVPTCKYLAVQVTYFQPITYQIGRNQDPEDLRRREFVIYICYRQSVSHKRRYVTELEDKVERLEALLKMASPLFPQPQPISLAPTLVAMIACLRSLKFTSSILLL